MTLAVTDLGRPGTGAFRYGGVLLAVGQLLVVAGVVGLARAGIAGTGWLAKLGLPAAGVGCLLICVAQLVMLFSVDVGEAIIGTGTPLTGLGMILAGAGVLRAGRWRGWRRFVPLACGLYVFVVLYPAEALTGAVSYPAIAGWYACWLLLGVALLDTEADWVTLPAMPGTGDG